jgi:hypothetical protein
MRMLNISHACVSDPKCLHWTLRAMFTTTFPRRFQLRFVSKLVKIFDEEQCTFYKQEGHFLQTCPFIHDDL